MQTKIAAARIASDSGVRTVITAGKTPENVLAILEGADIGTHFVPHAKPENARKRWIAFGLVPQGQLLLDAGAVTAICQGGKSLLAAGLTAVRGKFQANDAVILCDERGKELGRGLVNYPSDDLERICGVQSEDISRILGDGESRTLRDGESRTLRERSPDTVIHRDNLVLTR